MLMAPKMLYSNIIMCFQNSVWYGSKTTEYVHAGQRVGELAEYLQMGMGALFHPPRKLTVLCFNVWQ